MADQKGKDIQMTVPEILRRWRRWVGGWVNPLGRRLEHGSSTRVPPEPPSFAPRIRQAMAPAGERNSPWWARASARLVCGVVGVGPSTPDPCHDNEAAPGSVVSACERIARKPWSTFIGVSSHATASCALSFGGDDRAVDADGGDASPVEVRHSGAGVSSLSDTGRRWSSDQSSSPAARSERKEARARGAGRGNRHRAAGNLRAVLPDDHPAPPGERDRRGTCLGAAALPAGHCGNRAPPKDGSPSDSSCSQRTGTEVDRTRPPLMGGILADRQRRLWLAVTQTILPGEEVRAFAQGQERSWACVVERLQRANRAGVRAPIVKEGQPTACSQGSPSARCAANGAASQSDGAWVSFPRIG